MMEVLASTGRDDLATVYVAQGPRGRRLEFVESVQPPLTREEKWVLIISTLYGCPVGCRFCDAGGSYHGRVAKDEMLAQLDHMVLRRHPDGKVPSNKFKVQFSRMGEPSFNDEVIETMQELPRRYDAPGLMLSLSTVAPAGRDAFFERLLDVKRELYQGRFQFQFSLHSSDEDRRSWLIPRRTWSMERMAAYGAEMRRGDSRKVTLNFAVGEGNEIDPDALLRHFEPRDFVIKLTPVNPTHNAMSNRIRNSLDNGLAESLGQAGYDVILSIGEAEENLIGSNCGQYLKAYESSGELPGGYRYPLQDLRG